MILNNLEFLAQGLKVTVLLGVSSGITSLFLGIVLGILRYSKIFPLNVLATAFIELTRSIPLILYIVFIYLTCSPFLQQFSVLESLFGSLEFQSAYIALSLFTSAYIAEIIRSGLKSVEKDYVDASKSLGFSFRQSLKYVILPIAINRMIPALINQFITLIKDTSLASIIGLIELTRAGEIIYERNHQELEVLTVIALVYFSVCFFISLISKKIEQTPEILKEVNII